jgi:hypothetical protein
LNKATASALNSSEYTFITIIHPSSTSPSGADIQGAHQTGGSSESRGGRPESYCHRVMLDAVFYVVDNGQCRCLRKQAVP